MITQDDAVAEVLAKRTVSLDVAAASIPMGRNKAHRLVREGRFPVPVIPLGDHGVVVPTPELRRLLQLPNETQEGGELMSNVIEMDAFIESGNVIDKTGACEDCGCRDSFDWSTERCRDLDCGCHNTCLYCEGNSVHCDCPGPMDE